MKFDGKDEWLEERLASTTGGLRMEKYPPHQR